MAPSAPIIKRLLALVYDTCLVFAVLCVFTGVALWLNDGQSYGPNHIGFTLYLVFGAGIYLGWTWYKGGQTLGMAAWKIKLVTQDGDPLNWPIIVKRYLASVLGFWCAGIGYLWCFIDKDKQSLQDRLAKTRMVIK